MSTAEVMSQVVTELQGTFQCRNGELFMRLPLSEDLTEDTGAGKLILTSVESVLLTRQDLPDKHRVYEAKILHEGRGKDFVTLTLTPVCVRELELKAGMKVEVSVNCAMNRRFSGRKLLKLFYKVMFFNMKIMWS